MSQSSVPFSLDIATLRNLYETGESTPERVVDEVYARMERYPDPSVWISRVDPNIAREAARALHGKDHRTLPLYGVPFAVKDNIDVAGVSTTAGCPAFSYVPTESAFVVKRLMDAGAIFIGKTNMDQFAAGLVGTRSPYGACHNTFNPDYVSGGSSSGSAVAVAAGLVSFALGTDTAGSGRVPAAFNNLVGYKPSLGVLSTHGVVPACRSLDCVSIFTLNVADASLTASVARGYDARSYQPRTLKNSSLPKEFRFGVPSDSELRFFGDAEAERLYREAILRMEECGGRKVEIDYAPFRKTAELLYGGPWLAERFTAIASFLKTHANDIFPVTRQIIEKGGQVSGADAFNGLYALDALKTAAAREWEKVDCLLLPTAGTIYTIQQVESDPIALNTNLGYYTNFVNLLDCAGVAVPAGFRANGLPFGITLIAPAFSDAMLLDLSRRYEALVVKTLGTTGIPFSKCAQSADAPATHVKLAVVGAHLQGQPLNRELTELNARLVWTGRTAPVYRFYALQTTPPKPGMVRVDDGSGAAIEVEVWELDMEGFGRFVSQVPAPLAIGTLQLETGESVKGFVCEPAAILTAKEITHYGGWRRFRSETAPKK